MPVIEQALEQACLSLKDINLITCDIGPGSFTGIRIGIGTVLAFRDSLNIDCIGISSLEALAYNVSNNGLICSLIDAKNNNVYFGLFERQDDELHIIGNFEFKTIDDVISLFKSKIPSITFVGDGAVLYKELLQENFPNCNFASKNNLSSFSLGLAGLYNYKKGIKTSLIPLYLRKSQAERALEEKNKSTIS